MNRRFTIDGSSELERQLERLCNEVLKHVQGIVPASRLEAIFLGGGYGRGEGGVLRNSDGDHPYNDLEFYICIRGNPRLNERSIGKRLHQLGEQLSHDAGIEVEFKIASLAKLRASPPSMFLYDLAMGHRTVFGNDAALLQARFLDPAKIPQHEAARLLMNRCSGLLFSQERLSKTLFAPEDSDFVGRNHAKAQLAFGDVVLTMLGQYHWSCRERNQRLQRLSDGRQSNDLPIPLRRIVCHHTVGTDFKLHPKRTNSPPHELVPTQAELSELGKQLWLWVESQRLGEKFRSIEDYLSLAINKCPETNSLKNRLINLRQFGFHSLFTPRATRYPRERLLHALPLLLWRVSSDLSGGTLRRIQEELNTDSTDFSSLVQAYRSLWQHFN